MAACFFSFCVVCMQNKKKNEAYKIQPFGRTLTDLLLWGRFPRKKVLMQITYIKSDEIVCLLLQYYNNNLTVKEKEIKRLMMIYVYLLLLHYLSERIYIFYCLVYIILIFLHIKKMTNILYI